MNWHPFAEKFPLLEGDDYEALKASIKSTKGIDEQPIIFRVLANGKIEGLDGRNRERACRELGIKPKMKKVSVKDEDVKDFILRRNLHRRHMTREMRQAIVAELRADGESTRRIAETVGVSQQTVVNDLSAGEQNCSPGTVTGQDGKTYPAKSPVSPSAFCSRCQRVGPVKDCPDCYLARKAKPKPADKPLKNGEVLFDWKLFYSEWGAVLRQIDKMGRAYGGKESPDAEGLRQKLVEFKADFRAFFKKFAKVNPPRE